MVDDIKDVDKRVEKNEEEEEEEELPRRPFLRGSDPRIATCRGKLQNRRSKLNQEINKELRLRAGAENLFKATTNKKLRETVAVELSFVNSNLQLLKEQLAELNSSVELYQSDSTGAVMPMIPLGLKETKEIDFRDPFKDFILEHYSEDANKYEDAIADFMDTRQAMRTPLRDTTGIGLLFRYYNQLYYVERRFFPPDRSLGIYFEWFDSLTGVPSCQRTVAFEKACVLFNMGAIYTQIGAKQDRSTAKGLDSAVDNFLRAAGTFRYIHENFTNAPSMDLGPEILEMLVQLMLAQARECLLEKLQLQSEEKRSVDICFDLSQEAAELAECYAHVHELISHETVHDYVPYSWISLTQVKGEYYTSMAHWHVASGVLHKEAGQMSTATKETLQFLHVQNDITQLDIRCPKDNNERRLLGRAHLREALVLQEECQRLHRMCRELRGKHALALVLRIAHKKTLQAYTSTDTEDDFSDMIDPPQIQPATKFQLSLTPPDFAQYRVNDLFRDLGPIAIFSAKRHWSAPRLVQLHRGRTNEGFGFSVRGDAPVIIALVEAASLAEFGGVKEGDFIVSIGDKDVKWAAHDEVVTLIKSASDSLSLKLVTPMDRNYLKSSKSNQSKGSVSTHSSSSGISSGMSSPSGSMAQHNHNNSKRLMNWNPFKRNHSTSREGKDFFENVILR
ncbi:rhophilin-2 isoform X2 [Anthonomus grandis grandis]|uniref:rhophilin-2 isoform X2 n=1 Tax=Anthonomus grandis grandis TaxID=2921223 RepID=UPI002165CFF7|nr:rhophilin-2 isoform X2 [Anthonomus grandis grandis]